MCIFVYHELLKHLLHIHTYCNKTIFTVTPCFDFNEGPSFQNFGCIRLVTRHDTSWPLRVSLQPSQCSSNPCYRCPRSLSRFNPTSRGGNTDWQRDRLRSAAAAAMNGGGGITAAATVLATVCDDVSNGGRRRRRRDSSSSSSRVKIAFVVLLFNLMDGEYEPD